MIHKIKQIGLFVSLITMILGCNNSKSSKNQQENKPQDTRIFVSKEQFEKNMMELITPVEMEFPKMISVNGIVDVPPQNKAVISSIMGGYVKDIPFLKGDKVKKGQPLLYIENQEFVRLQQQFLEVKQQLEYLKSEFERQKILASEQISSQKNFLKAQSEYHSALAQFNGLKKQLQLININPNVLHFENISSVVAISSPINGNISDILVEQGAFVSPTSALVKVIDNKHLHLVLTVFEKDAVFLKEGQKVLFTLPEVSEQNFSAKVILIASNIDEKRSVQVNAHIDDEKNTNFISGMFVSGQIITESGKGYGLSEISVAETQNGIFALKLNEKTDEGYYFDKIQLSSNQVFNGHIKIENNEKNQFLKGRVFDLIN